MRTTTRRPGRLLGGVAAALVAAAGCGAPAPAAGSPAPVPVAGSPAPATGGSPTPAGDCSGFALSLAVDRGGRPSPEAAAEWYAAHGGDSGVPSSGWRAGVPDQAGVPVTSGSWTLHTLRVCDGSWFVDSGRSC